MLRYISENKRKDGTQNEEIHLKIAATLIDDKMRESHLKWFDHIQRRAINAIVRKSELIKVEGKKKCQNNISRNNIKRDLSCQLRKQQKV